MDLCSTQLHSQKTSPNIGNSFEKKVDSFYTDEDDDEEIDTSFNDNNSKIKRPISNTVHSIKERERRLSLKKSFNKLKFEMSTTISNFSPIDQTQIELKQSLTKGLAKSKQKILKEVS